MTPAFNGDADPKLVTRGLSVTLYKDASHEHELGDDEVTSDATLYGKIGIDFASDEMPTLDHPNIKYVFPDNVDVKDIPKSALYDAQNNRAGTWYVKNGIAYLNYSETWLKAHTSEVAAHISFEFAMSGEDSGDGSHVAINFPGAASTVKINTKDGSVSGNKFGADASKEWEAPSFDASDNSYTWTIKVSPSSYATGLKIVDEIGSNLSFVKDSFKLVDKNGQAVSGTCNVSFDGQKATIFLGDLTKGDYYVQYKTKVSDDALAALGNGQELSGVSNKAQWVWGSNGQNKGDSGSKEPQKAKYSLVSKSHSSSSTPEDIEWVCDLNTGSLKADLSGYVFTDTLASGHSFKPGTNCQVVDAAGNVIASGNVPADDKTLSISLPQNVGKKQLKVTYHTVMDNVESTKAASNTAKLAPSDGQGLKGDATDSFKPKRIRNHLSKELVSSESAATDGTATWKSKIAFSTMESDVDVSKVYFLDDFSQLPSWKQAKISDVSLTTTKGTKLTQDVDYVIDPGQNGEWNKLGITFKDTELVKGLVGVADVVVSYKTTVVSADGTYDNGTYTNVSSLKIDGAGAGEAKASYTIDKKTIPSVSKKATGDSWWDSSYEWGDGTKGAWLTNWEVHVNCLEPNAWTHTAASDLKGQDVVVTDTLGDGISYVAGKGAYTLNNAGDGSYSSLWNQSIEPSISGNELTFTIKTDSVANSEGSWKGYVSLGYQTAVKASSVKPGETSKFSNTASAVSGATTFPEGSASTDITNKVLTKESALASDNYHISYTITVNPNALTLGGKDGKLTLVDKMGSTAEFANGSLRVADGETDITDQCSVDFEKTDEGTTMTLVVPDSKKLVVTYDAAPQGNVGDSVQVENTASLSGFASVTSTDSKRWTVHEATAGTESKNYGIVISKTDSSGLTPLEGAKFELHEVDLDASTPGNLVSKLVTSVGENPKTTDSSGVVKFGDEQHALASGKLYYYVETQAPVGYEITKATSTYVMFSGTSESAKADFAKAKAQAKALGVTFAEGTNFNAYDRLADGTFEIKVDKTVESSDAPTGQTFTFSATPTGTDADKAPVLSDVAITDSGSASFEGTLAEEMVGHTFTYLVHEEGTAPSGWTYDTSDVTVTVAVKSEDGKVKADVSYEKEGEGVSSAAFVNRYKDWSPVKAALGVYKTVNGENASGEDTFTFVLEPQDGAPAPANTESSCKGGIASFGDVEFTKAGTYRYVVRETSDLGEGWTNDSDAECKVVVVRDEGEHALKVASIDWGERAYNVDNAVLCHFDNKYEKPSEPSEPDQPTEPSEPDQPTDPDQPSQPDTPDKPSQPDQPSEPSKPDQPSEPDNPEQPDNPESPDTPETPDDEQDDPGDEQDDPSDSDDENGKTDDSNGSEKGDAVATFLPQTGDNTLFVAGVLVILAAASGAVLLFTRRKRG